MISDTKDKILECAARIFFANGFSTGIDRVISECGVAKMTLYKHFKTKHGLICAILGEIQAFLKNHILIETTLNTKPPRAQLEAAALILCKGMSNPDLKAGLAVRALIEFPDPKNAVHEAARQLDLTILKWFERLCEDASIPNAKQAAHLILQIAKGCFLMVPAVGVDASEAIALDLLRPVLAQVKNVPQRQAEGRRQAVSSLRPLDGIRAPLPALRDGAQARHRPQVVHPGRP